MSDSIKSVQVIIDNFLGVASKKTAHLTKESWDELLPRIEKLAGEVENSNVWRVVDLQSAGFFKFTSLIIAIYRILTPDCEHKSELIDAIREACKVASFPESMDDYFENRFGMLKGDTPEQSWHKFTHNFIEPGEKLYGKAWSYEEGIRDEKRFFINMPKCGFNDFLRGNGEVDLLHTFCVMDYVWGDALEEYGIKFGRPTTLAEGSELCRFQFFRMNKE